MHISLFDQNLLMWCSIISTIACTSLLWIIGGRQGLKKHRLWWVAGSGLLGTVVVAIIVWQTVGLDNTPNASIFLTFITFAVLALGVVFFRNGWRVRITSLAGIISLLILQGLMLNDFYRYYPTLASIFTTTTTDYQKIQNTLAPSQYKLNDTTSLEEQMVKNTAEKGMVYNIDIPGKVSHFKGRNGTVYLPAAYQNNTTVRFPVLVMLSGTPGTPQDWVRAGSLQQTVDAFATRHAGIAPIIIMPDHNGGGTTDTECIDSSRGNAETYLSVDVPNYIKANFRAATSPDNWAIGGLSEGGMCSAMLTLRHQDVYRHFLDLGGEVMPDFGSKGATASLLKNPQEAQAHNIDWLLNNRPLDPQLTGQFGVGSGDKHALITTMQSTHQLAQSRGMTTSMEVMPRTGHSFAVWAEGLKDNIARLSYYMGATRCETSCR